MSGYAHGGRVSPIALSEMSMAWKAAGGRVWSGYRDGWLLANFAGPDHGRVRDVPDPHVRGGAFEVKADAAWAEMVYKFVSTGLPRRREMPRATMDNPYERRRRSQREGLAFTNGMVSGYADAPRESPLTFEDVEALVQNAVHRGRRESAARHDEELQHARRLAWDEGHEIGNEAGKAHVLAEAERRHSGDVHERIHAGNALLMSLKEDPRKVSKADLETELRRVMGLLERVVESHHAGFEHLPF